MLEVSNIKVPLDVFVDTSTAERMLPSVAAKVLNVKKADIQQVRVLKRSVDARRKSEIHFVVTLGVSLFDKEYELILDERSKTNNKKPSGINIKQHQPYKPLLIPCRENQELSSFSRPIVVGAGPAGLFCALYLARAGLRPLLIERGGDVDERTKIVNAFNTGSVLDEQTNIQFGEGGAGTFSDGKLTTNIKNPLTRHVLQWFVEAGAPEEILYLAKPHMGTDYLACVVKRLRTQIQEAGGEVCFHTQLVDLCFEEDKLVAVDIIEQGHRRKLAATRVVLACGHSARDTFEMLYEAGIKMEQKPFSVGVRIEHLQEDINRAQYGMAANHPALGAAEYKLSAQLPSGRGVYTFCMCPGGEVVCAASEEGGVVVNGMSNFARDGKNSNSALLVGVDSQDFESDHPLAGIDFQRSIEQAAYKVSYAMGGSPYKAPAQTVGDFLVKKAGSPSVTLQPSYARGVVWCDLRECLPSFVVDSLEEALRLLERRLAGFSAANAVMTGVETRSSSPVRVIRNELMEALLVGVDADAYRESQILNTEGCGVYPCGEGAGYAGGIMSAACDGLRVAQAVAKGYGCPSKE